MYLLLTDETNRTPSKDVKFFMYGGLFFPFEKLVHLDNEISRIRNEAGYRDGDEFKFDTRARPEHVTIEACTEAKRQIVELCLKSECKFIAHVILHDIIKNQDLDQQVLWAADYVIGRFNKYLTDIDSYGICAVDNLPVNAQFRYLSDKFCKGLTIDGGESTLLDRIKLFTATCINASHLSSAMDIVLGSFRYCINNPKNIEAARGMMHNVLQMMWHTRSGDTFYIGGKGLILRPKVENIKVANYKTAYKDLMDHINELLADAP